MLILLRLESGMPLQQSTVAESLLARVKPVESFDRMRSVLD